MPVKTETLEGFALDLKRSDYVLSVDIAKGYHHFRLHPGIRNWFILKVDNRYIRCIALPFGWKLSLEYFIKLMRLFVRFVRNRLRLRMHPYMDDFLVAVRRRSRLHKGRGQIDRLLKACGLQRKEDEGNWVGTQCIEHLGFNIDATRMTFGIIAKGMEKLKGISQQLLRQARRNRRLVYVQLLRHFAGVAISCSLAMPLALFYTRSIYDSLKLNTSNSGKRVKLLHSAIRDLKQWRDLAHSPPGRPVSTPSPTLALHSDASKTIGQGETLGSNLQPGAQGTWEARGFWDPLLRVKPITFLELRAVTDNIWSFANILRSGTHLRVWEDNQAVVAILNAMTTKSRPFIQELRVLHRLLQKLGISIEALYLPSAVNRFADRLSRLHTLDDWRINQETLRPLLESYRPTIDRFADSSNKVSAKFNSEFACPGSLGINALQQDWRSELNFVILLSN